jgi:hypothetical protein
VKCSPRAVEQEVPLQDVTLGDDIGLQPGATYTEELFRWQCCVYAVAAPVPARFLVDPDNRGVSIHPATGVVTVDAHTAPGTVVRVYAILSGGKRIVSHDVHVYTPQSNPFVGRWHQTADLICFAGASSSLEWPPLEPIQELYFLADGTYKVVRHPLEISYEYAGPYTFELAGRNIVLGVRNVTRFPANFRAQGQFEIRNTDPQQLVLKGVWLGKTAPFGDGCGAVFVRDR